MRSTRSTTAQIRFLVALAVVSGGGESALAAQSQGTTTVSYANSLATPSFAPVVPAFAVAKSAYIISNTRSANALPNALYLANNLMAQWTNGFLTTLRGPGNPVTFAQPGPNMSTLQYFATVSKNPSDNTDPWTVSATFSVTWEVPDVTVALSPGSAAVQLTRQQQFRATVTNTSNTAVQWAVREGTVCGTITSTGLYTAPASLPGRACTVVATSLQQPSQLGTAAVTVTVPPVLLSNITVTPGLGSATFAWNTNIAATTQVTCGSGSYSDATLTSGHFATVNGLNPGSYTCTLRSVSAIGSTGTATRAVVTADANAVLSSVLKVPYCPLTTHGSSACDSGRSLLAGKADTEQNAPNTLNPPPCFDGYRELYPGEFDELSIQQITVSSVDGTSLAEGKRVQASVRINATNVDETGSDCLGCNLLDLWYMPNHVSGSTAWQYLGTFTPAGSGLQTVATQFTMGTGGRHVLRANLRNTSTWYHERYASTCSGSVSDHDDLVFYVTAEPGKDCSPDVSSDVNNCGACGVVCTASAPNTVPYCSYGCGVTCSPGWYDCNGSLADGCESADPTCGVPPSTCVEPGGGCGSDADCCSGSCGFRGSYCD